MFGLILWMLILLAGGSQACPDAPCDTEPANAVNCSVVKGVHPVPRIVGVNAPAIRDLRVTLGSIYVDGACKMRLNTTWRVSNDSSLHHLQGFLLSYVFTYNSQPIVVSRTILVNVSDWSQLPEILFIHQCMVPVFGTFYYVNVYGLPMSRGRFGEGSTQYWVPRDAVCGGAVELRDSADWRVSGFFVNSRNSSITVCFDTAPPPMVFTKYRVSLLRDTHDDIMNPTIGQKTVTAVAGKVE